MKNKLRDRMTANNDMPTYNLTPQKNERKMKRWQLATIAAIVFLIFAIYVPPLIFDLPDVGRQYSSVVVTPNDAAKEVAIAHLRNNPNDDYDGDGLINELEGLYGTNAFAVDSDADGANDYAELYITNTQPTVYDDAAISYIQNYDLAEAYKINDVILWADNYRSLATGSVLAIRYEECTVYRFTNFSGWANFGSVGYPYIISEDKHIALDKHEQMANTYRIPEYDGVFEVYYYDKDIEPCHILSFFGSKTKVKDNWLGKTLSFILPSRGMGIITCAKASTIDLTTKDVGIISNEMITHNIAELPETRFERSMTDIADFRYIIEQIDSGNNVAISLMSHTSGEAVIAAYGYTDDFSLLIYDPQTGDDLGVLTIELLSTCLLDQNGNQINREYYEFSGCGFSSLAKHRIAIIETYTGKQEIEESTEPSTTVDPAVEAEEILNEKIQAVIHPGFGEEGQYFEGPGRYQITIENVVPEQIPAFVLTVQQELEFNRYYEVTEDGRYLYVILSDKDGNVVTAKYDSKKANVVIRFERFDAEQTVELKEEFFVE